VANTPEAKFGWLVDQAVYGATWVVLLLQDGKLKIDDPVSSTCRTREDWREDHAGAICWGHTSGIPSLQT